MARSYLLLLIFFSSLFTSLPVFAHPFQSNGLDLNLNWKSDQFNLSYEEHTRRVLAASRYISYGALRRDSVPCSYRGASYYNCRPGAHANPYARGCSAITRCRRWKRGTLREIEKSIVTQHRACLLLWRKGTHPGACRKINWGGAWEVFSFFVGG
jgi:Rapid ALkalinization Factor (RALF)